MDVTGVGDRPLEALAGRYEVERELGRGGMATVWLATDATSGQLVAIKMLHPDLTAALGARRFQREIEIERSLDHPNILSITDAGEAGGHLYYVMPYVRGESLRARLQRDGPLPVEDALRLAAQVARALAYAHARGIVHRDVKPENILLDEDGQAILADFGIARALSADQEQRLTQTGVTLGTPTYMSPEQCMAEKGLDGRSDIYSLGCVLFEMLAGEPPFTGANAQAVTARHLLEAVPCLTLVRPAVSDEVEDVVLRALAKTPADRFATVGELATAVERLLTTGHATSARTVATPRNVLAQRRQRRRQHAAWGATVGALLVAALAGGVAWRRNSSTVTPESAEAARHVAVLYFDDLTPGRRLGWLADGLTESLIDELAQVQALDVVSRNGVLPFRDADPGRDSVARALGVGLLVDGRVEEDAGRVRVTVDLVDAASGANLRTHTFTQPEGDALQLRDSLATTLEAYLRSQIGEQVRRREQRDRTRSDEAWMLVQRVESARKRAGTLWDGGDTAGASRVLDQADSMAARAASLDARWAAPEVLRGRMAYQRATNESEPAAAAPWLDSALAHARAALARDARNAEALELRGAVRYARVQHGLARDSADVRALTDSAEADLRAATTLAPWLAMAWVRLSEVDYRKLNIVEANRDAQQAYQADAYLTAAPLVLWRLFATSYDLQSPADAERWCTTAARRFPDDPDFRRCQLLLMNMRGARPDIPAAWRLYGELRTLSPKPERAFWESWDHILVAAALGRAGMADSARHVLLAARVGADVDPRGELQGLEAFARTLVGDDDEALRLLTRYLQQNPEHREGFAKLNAWWWQSINRDPRFLALVGAH